MGLGVGFACRQAEAPASGSVLTDPLTGMKFVYVRGGCYRMGDTFNDPGSHGMSVHEACVDDFWLGMYEVTQEEWGQVMSKGGNPAAFQDGPRYPVESVNWQDAQDFIAELNSMSAQTKPGSGRQYRLPTEAEWEYAARGGGKEIRFGTGKDTIGPDEANFDAGKKHKELYSRSGENRKAPLAVGSFPPNGLGLYDMTGNVWEWCSDWYGEDYYTSASRDNPKGPASGTHRVFRGGSWYCSPGHVRASFRDGGLPDLRAAHLGLRLVLTSEEQRQR
ncbi:MAG: hypothetical protein A2512_06845 [Deltaproteobacteria bacterium RIFOXYD12_FULL_56_24]|nr:MAG: hypothetical protein A2512_06845 [Deltaproteobacteria bacterium RIFOXYD12_FULL_56_24]